MTPGPKTPVRPEVLGWLLVASLGAGSYWAPRPWRMMLLVLVVLILTALHRWRARRDAVWVLRRLRHRQANQLQVIQGWMQLNRSDRAAEQVAQVIARLGEEGNWYRELPLSWLYTVLMVDVLAESKGIHCQWHIAGEPGWAARLRFRAAAARAVNNAGAALDIHLDAQGFSISLPDPKSLPGWRNFGVTTWIQGDTIVLLWRSRMGKRHPAAKTRTGG